jgi:hypothetical protein
MVRTEVYFVFVLMSVYLVIFLSFCLCVFVSVFLCCSSLCVNIIYSGVHRELMYEELNVSELLLLIIYMLLFIKVVYFIYRLL